MFKKVILFIILALLLALPIQAQGPVIYLPIIFKAGEVMTTPDPILRITDGTVIIDLLASDSGWELSDPYWLPQIAQFKSGGNYVSSAIAEGERLVSREYSNVVESIPLSVRGTNQATAIGTIRELLQLGRQASDFWTESYEFDDVWIEARPACDDCLTGYARIIKMQIPELGTSPFGQPFFTPYGQPTMENITLIIEREPLWRGVPPGEIIGPLYNLIKNPDFELWNFGVTDSQPDSWNNLTTIQITGQNSREASGANSGSYALKVRVSGSTLTGKFKGVSQVISGIQPDTEYTVVAWVRSEGVSNGVGRILVTYSSQLEVYRSSSVHGWTLYTGKFTTGENDTVAINLEILTTAANTDGTVYFDSLMLIQGDWEEEAALNVLPYISSSHIVNHWDQPGEAVIEAGDINWVDAWNVPGDVDALVLLEFVNNTVPDDLADQVEVYETIRIGMRRTNNVQNFQNYLDPNGLTDTSASSDDRLESPNLNSSWLELASKLLTSPEAVLDNEGRFRVLARVYDPKSAGSPTLQTRLSYFIGGSGVGDKTLDAASSPVRQQWHIVNLSANAAVNFDKKFSYAPPGQIGYKIEMRRTTGSDKGYLDYVLVMPTDGGYIEANLGVPLAYKTALVIDGTLGQPEIYSLQPLSGFRVVFTTPGQQQNIVGYKGSLFFGAGTRIYRFNGNTGTLMYQYGGAGIAFPNAEVFNGKLMITAAGQLFESDGFTFPGTVIPAVSINAGAVKSFDGKLWLLDVLSGTVIFWNGSTVTTSLSVSGLDSTAMETYAGKLYAAINTPARIYEYDPVSSSWSLSFTFPGSVTACRGLGVFQGKLYAGTDTSGELYVFDGDTWSLAKTFNTSTELDGIRAIREFDGKLYVGGRLSGGGGGRIMVSEDGTNWEVAYDTTTYFISTLASYQGNLYATTRLIKGGGAFDFLALTPDITNQFQVSDWRGRPFAAPSRTKTDAKRHRYIFSYDRQGFINNIDDAGLVGIGFVPRYLALRGKD